MRAYLKLMAAILAYILLSVAVYVVYQNYFLAKINSTATITIKSAVAPTDITDPFLLGQYFFNTGDRADGTYDLIKARANYQIAIEQDPKKNLLAWHQLGRIDFLEGRFTEAIDNFNKQIEYFGDELPNVYYMLGLTYGYMGRNDNRPEYWQKAEANFLKYLEFDPTSPWARVDLSWVYFTQGKYEAMVPLLEVGLVHEPANPWLLNMYGLALMNLEEEAKARQHFLWAKAEANRLTVEEWGRSYPGNNPEVWAQGLAEFRAVIDKNVELTTKN